MKEFSHEFIARLTQLDYARAMAFVAFDEATNEMVGVVRIHSDSIYANGEYAILLRSDLKGRGLGWALMQLIIEYAKSEGLKRNFGRGPSRELGHVEHVPGTRFRGKVRSDRARSLRCDTGTLTYSNANIRVINVCPAFIARSGS